MKAAEWEKNIVYVYTYMLSQSIAIHKEYISNKCSFTGPFVNLPNTLPVNLPSTLPMNLPSTLPMNQPINKLQQKNKAYDVYLNSSHFDPTISGSPPSVFIKNLHQRMDNYFDLK